MPNFQIAAISVGSIVTARMVIGVELGITAVQLDLGLSPQRRLFIHVD